MTIYTDGINHYLGDCSFANHDINFKTLNFFRGEPHQNISAELSALCQAAGLNFRNVASQSLFNNNSADFSLLTFASELDSINDRYTFNKVNSQVGASAPYSDSTSMYYDPSDVTQGYLMTNNTLNNSNRVIDVSNNTSSPLRLTGAKVETSWAGVASGNSLALFCYSVSKTPTLTFSYHFWYAGTFGEVNTNFDYYSNNILTKSICLYVNSTFSGGFHYIEDLGKPLLQTGKANYSIACTDSQTPTSQWTTDFIAYDSNTEIGQPAIGKVENLILGVGSYVIGQPVILDTPHPNLGINCWLPVGSFAGKTLLMQCYSSLLPD